MIQISEETEEEISDISPIINHLQNAIDTLKKALDIASENSDRPIQIYLLLGEAHVHLGNALDQDNDESEDAIESIESYKEAVDYFSKVQELDIDALPEQFEEFLLEWKAQMEETSLN